MVYFIVEWLSLPVTFALHSCIKEAFTPVLFCALWFFLKQVMHNLVDLSDLYFSEDDIDKMWVIVRTGFSTLSPPPLQPRTPPPPLPSIPSPQPPPPIPPPPPLPLHHLHHHHKPITTTTTNTTTTTTSTSSYTTITNRSPQPQPPPPLSLLPLYHHHYLHFCIAQKHPETAWKTFIFIFCLKCTGLLNSKWTRMAMVCQSRLVLFDDNLLDL